MCNVNALVGVFLVCVVIICIVSLPHGHHHEGEYGCDIT